MIERRTALALFVLSCFSCSRPATVARAAVGDEWGYEITAGQGAKDLLVTASFPPGSEPELSVDDGAEPYVRDVLVSEGAHWQPVAPKDLSWFVPACRDTGCRIRYRFLLADASAALRDPDLALAHEGVFVAPPSTWLLRPLLAHTARTFRFHVSTPPGVKFASGVFPASGADNTFAAGTGDLASAPYSAFGPFRPSPMDIGGRTIDIALAPGTFGVGEPSILAWIEGSAKIVEHYYGRFPVDRVLVIVLPADGRGLGYGKTLGNGGASILLPVGRRTAQRELDDDWMLVHEMIHLGFPNVPRQHIWLEEGIATYVEPLARARLGRLSAEAVWAGMMKGLPHGMPGPGDEGLDNTHTWGRTYWGGALYCLLADLEIRQRTDNARSLDDALRAILRSGGNVSVRWDLDRALEEGDRATGLSVLRDLHHKMGSAPHPIDLPALWQKLGVKLEGSKIVLDDTAPLSGIRRALTAESPPTRLLPPHP